MMMHDLRTRILAAVGVSGLISMTAFACGSSDAAPSPSSDASAADAGGGGDAPSLDGGSTDSGANLADAGGNGGDGGDAQPQPTVRRPFLVGSRMRRAGAASRSDWADSTRVHSTTSSLDALTRGELAAAWVSDALEEHASVAAFARFAMHLLAVGAPPDFVVGAQRASLDEIDHAKDCFALAHKHGAVGLGPGALDLNQALGLLSLADLAALTAEEGCIGETLGVALAATQLAHATDPDARRVLERIVVDETRHAELSWRFLAWALANDDKDLTVRHAVNRAIKRAVKATFAMEIRAPRVGLSLDAWRAHGRSTCAEARGIAETSVREVVIPALAALGLTTQALLTNNNNNNNNNNNDDDDDDDKSLRSQSPLTSLLTS